MDAISYDDLYEELGETNQEAVLVGFFGADYYDEGIDPTDMIFYRNPATGGLVEAQDSAGNTYYPAK